MIAVYMMILVGGLVSVVVVTVHELFEHNDPPPLPRPGSDGQWAAMNDAMRRYRKHRARGRRRG